MGHRGAEAERTQLSQLPMQPHQPLTVPPQRELRSRLRPQPVPPQREGSWRSHRCPPGQLGGDCQADHQDEGEERHSSSHWSARRFFEARAGRAASSSFLWQLWLCSYVRLTYSLPHALHADGGKKTTERPSVRVVNPRRKARSIEPMRTCTAMTAASRKHQSLRLLREYHLLFIRTISIMRKSDGWSTPRHESVMTSPRRRPQVKRRWTLPRTHRNPTGSTQRMGPTLGTDERFLHTFITRTHSATRPHQQGSASFCPRTAPHCFPSAPMSEGSSSSWWEGWSGTYHGWHDLSSPNPTSTEQAPDEQVMNTVHRLQDRLQKMQALTQRRSHKTGSERATSVSKGNAAYDAMEAVVTAREWQAEAKRAYDQKFEEVAEAEETYHNAIKRTLEKTEALERHVKTVTMREDSLAFNEAAFCQTLIDSQEGTIRNSTPYMDNCASPAPPNGDLVLLPLQASTASAGESRDVSFSSRLLSHLFFSQARTLVQVLHVAHSVPRCDFAGLMVPRRAHAAELSHDERALAWALLIESGHIPLRTRLGTCSRDFYRPLRRRLLVWTQRIIFQYLHNVWMLLQANRG